MAALVAFIEVQVGEPVSHRFYTDTSPILERELAQRAGLGWIGKNTCLIHPRMGSYFLLAEILLGIELEADQAFTPDHCGTCTRCLEACPTSCILPDRTIDASRCISYLTIELKGEIPDDLRSRTGNWIFGCDICQQVCPWNQRFAEERGDPAFSARPGVPSPNLVDEVLLTQSAFSEKFKGSPVKRAKRRGYLRNVIVAIGNTVSEEERDLYLPVLERVLTQEIEPLIRGHAAWALGQIAGEEALGFLVMALQTEENAWVHNEIVQTIERIQP
jgi:epoxyqueuosine reductase